MAAAWIVYRKELQEILRDRRTLMAIGLAALATPLVLFAITQVSTKTATQTYVMGYSGDIPIGLDILLRATGLKLVLVADPAVAAKQQVDLGVAFLPGAIDEYYDPSRQGAQIADVRLQTVLGQYDAAQAAAALKVRGIDPGILTPVKLVTHPLSSPVKAASNAFLSFFLPYILITMILTGGFSAALDSTAGERERRTLESLLLTPAPRSRVLLGKIAAIMTISLASAVAAIGSMFVALSQISTPGLGGSASHITLSPAAVPVMVWLALLIAISFSAVTLALGTLAKSFRQDQDRIQDGDQVVAEGRVEVRDEKD
jgi:sodium transport system permease protein